MLDSVWNFYFQQNVELFCSNYLVIFIWCMIGLKIVDAVFDCLVNWQELQYLKTQQVNVPCATITANNIPTDAFKNFRKDGIRRHSFLIVQKVSHAIFDCIKLFVGYYNFIWNLSLILAQILYWDAKNQALVSPLFVFILNAFSFIEDLPFICYRHYFIEKTYKNFSEMRIFLLEYIKNILHSQLLMFPTITLVIALIYMENMYAYLFLIIIAIFFEHFGKIFQLQYLQINNKQILPRCNLRKQIIKLCQICAFPLGEIYFVNELKTEYLTPIQFTGYKNKNILIYNSIFLDKTESRERLNVEHKEVLAVLAQMIGHWKENHELKLYMLNQIKYLLIFMLYKIIYKSTTISGAVGFPKDINPYVCGFIVLFRYVMAPFCTIVNRLIYTIEKQYIIKADTYAHTMRYGALLRSALIRLSMNYESSSYWDWLNLTSYRQQHNLITRCYNLFALTNEVQPQQPIELNHGLNDLSKSTYKHNVHIGPYPINIDNSQHLCERCFHMLKSEQNCIPHNYIENTVNPYGTTETNVKTFLTYENIQYPEVKLKRLSAYNDAKESRARKLLNNIKKYRNEGGEHDSKYDIESSEGIFQRKPYECKLQIDCKINETTRKDIEADFNLEKRSYKPSMMQQEHNSFILREDVKDINAEKHSSKATMQSKERNCFILGKDIKEVNLDKDIKEVILGKEIREIKFEKATKNIKKQKAVTDFRQYLKVENVKLENDKPKSSILIRKNIQVEKTTKDIKTVKMMQDVKLNTPICTRKEVKDLKFKRLGQEIKDLLQSSSNEQKLVQMQNRKPRNIVAKEFKVANGTIIMAKIIKLGNDVKMAKPNVIAQKVIQEQHQKIAQEQHQKIAQEQHQKTTQEHQKIAQEQHQKTTQEHQKITQEHQKIAQELHRKIAQELHQKIVQKHQKIAQEHQKIAQEQPKIEQEQHQNIAQEQQQKIAQEQQQKIAQEQQQKIAQEQQQKIAQEHQKIAQEQYQKTVKDITILKMMKDGKANNAVKCVKCVKLMNIPKHFQELKIYKESAQQQKRQQNIVENLTIRKISTPITNSKTITPLFIKSEHKRV